MGSFTAWMFLKEKEEISALKCIRHINKNSESNPFAKLFDMLIFVILGGTISVLILEPTSNKHAIIFGISWLSLVNQVLKRGDTDGNDKS